MNKLLKTAANCIAFLYSSVVVLTFIALGTITLLALATLIFGLLGGLNSIF